MGAENEASQRAVEELVAHYQAKARAVSRTGVAIGAFAGVLVGSIPLSPLRAAWPIPSSYGFATLLGGLVVGVLIGYVVGDPRGKLYQRMAEQAPPPAPARAADLPERRADGSAADRAHGPGDRGRPAAAGRAGAAAAAAAGTGRRCPSRYAAPQPVEPPAFALPAAAPPHRPGGRPAPAAPPLSPPVSG